MKVLSIAVTMVLLAAGSSFAQSTPSRMYASMSGGVAVSPDVSRRARRIRRARRLRSCSYSAVSGSSTTCSRPSWSRPCSAPKPRVGRRRRHRHRLRAGALRHGWGRWSLPVLKRRGSRHTSSAARGLRLTPTARPPSPAAPAKRRRRPDGGRRRDDATGVARRRSRRRRRHSCLRWGRGGADLATSSRRRRLPPVARRGRYAAQRAERDFGLGCPILIGA